MRIVETVEDLRLAIVNEEYNVKEKFVPVIFKEGTIFDENKTVKWNYEEARMRNEETNKKLEDLEKEKSILTQKLREDMITAFSNDSGLSKQEIELIYEYALKFSSVALSDLIFKIESLIVLSKKLRNLNN